MKLPEEQADLAVQGNHDLKANATNLIQSFKLNGLPEYMSHPELSE